MNDCRTKKLGDHCSTHDSSSIVCSLPSNRLIPENMNEHIIIGLIIIMADSSYQHSVSLDSLVVSHSFCHYCRIMWVKNWLRHSVHPGTFTILVFDSSIFMACALYRQSVQKKWHPDKYQTCLHWQRWQSLGTLVTFILSLGPEKWGRGAEN